MAIEVYPVVHINNPTQAVDQVGVALGEGADGVYLIDHHSVDIDRLLATFSTATTEHPGAFLGINALQLPGSLATFVALMEARASGRIDRFPAGVWVDDADPHKESTLELRQANPELMKIRYLGGVAFKYTRFFTDLSDRASQEANRLEKYMDVVTTSGSGTGTPPSPGKIIAMKNTIGPKPLAVASGINCENLKLYKGYLDQLLVASSVETVPGSGIFDRDKLADLIQLAHEL